MVKLGPHGNGENTDNIAPGCYNKSLANLSPPLRRRSVRKIFPPLQLASPVRKMHTTTTTAATVNYSLGTRRGILNPSKPLGHVFDMVFKSS